MLINVPLLCYQCKYICIAIKKKEKKKKVSRASATVRRALTTFSNNLAVATESDIDKNLSYNLIQLHRWLMS